MNGIPLSRLEKLRFLDPQLISDVADFMMQSYYKACSEDIAKAFSVGHFRAVQLMEKAHYEITRRQFYENRYWDSVFRKAVDLYRTYDAISVEIIVRELNVTDDRALDMIRHMKAVRILKGGEA